ncbi:hypothetical protein BN14_08268 [Rhizoctonia solani AG-1 IB]|uniref:Uncharacterized protein n=1 Tax=Thanatephorus cucumeris (strain AG1-IB / isolate 7/3/14) TaxID=1108050 RepID=M5C552_THACB|nr:hypothetical protein BN14_08268 [Rhizoctonia solani AG-1 IB]
MNTQPPTESPDRNEENKRLFGGFFTDVDPDDKDGLTVQRLQQWRPFWQNPFVDPDLGNSPGSDLSRVSIADVMADDEKVLEKPNMSRGDTGLSKQSSALNSSAVVHAGPTWVNLFYDLAWTAWFASVTQNGQLDAPWDTVSYIAFFLAVWWLWASQTLYSVHFYTNDWVHLLSIFVQLVIFGLLAATTQGYNVISYILRSPGADTLDPMTIDQMLDPKRYQADRVASYSLEVIAFSLALIYVFAHSVAKEKGLAIPQKLCVLPFGLVISNALFWGCAGLTHSAKGKTVLGAKLKFVLWGVGLVVEVVLHAYMEWLDWEKTSFKSANQVGVSQDATTQPKLLKNSLGTSQSTPAEQIQSWPIPRTNVNLRTLYSIISAPGLGGPVPANMACTAFIVYFLAYFYFEGPTSRRDPKGSEVRKMWWMMLHLPFLLGIILLLLGVKNQFIMTSCLSTAEKTFLQFDQIMGDEMIALEDPTSASNLPIKNFMLKRGITWAEEFNKLKASVTDNGTIPLANVTSSKLENDVGIWYMRISLRIIEQYYMTFMGKNAKIDPSIETMMKNYYVNDTVPLMDWNEVYEPASLYHYGYESIISNLLKTHLQGARYIVALAGAIFISLGVMNRIHSKPRDRFQWGIVISRISMGVALIILLLLNVGSIQWLWVWDYEESKQAGVFRWVWAWMVLPTLAIAFATEFIIETVLLRCAGLAIAHKRDLVKTSLWRAFFNKPLSWSKSAK